MLLRTTLRWQTARGLFHVETLHTRDYNFWEKIEVFNDRWFITVASVENTKKYFQQFFGKQYIYFVGMWRVDK